MCMCMCACVCACVRACVRCMHARTHRSLRAFRVIRLFGRLGSLRDIIAALTAAVGPVMNAFLIMFIIGAICESSR